MEIKKELNKLSDKRFHNNACTAAYKSGVQDAYRICKPAVEKQTPMQHHHTRVRRIEDEVRESVCPNCLMIIATYKNDYPKYCCWCGQALDWSDCDE